MKKILLLPLIVLCAWTCETKQDETPEKPVFQSEKMQGKYKVDWSPLISKMKKENEAEGDTTSSDKMAMGFTSMIISSVEIQVSFYENNKGVMSSSGALVDFGNAMANNSNGNVEEFEYKVENDTVLFSKTEKDSVFRKIGYLKKFAGSYDFLRLEMIDEGSKNDELIPLNLIKIND